jgi:uncharacterized protein YceK
MLELEAMSRNFRITQCLFTAVVCLALCGCGTIATKASGEAWGNPYSGTRSSVCSFTDGLSKGQRPEKLFLPVLLIDAPLSFIADTVVLPVDLIRWNPSSCREVPMVPNISLQADRDG